RILPSLLAFALSAGAPTSDAYAPGVAPMRSSLPAPFLPAVEWHAENWHEGVKISLWIFGKVQARPVLPVQVPLAHSALAVQTAREVVGRSAIERTVRAAQQIDVPTRLH